MTRLNGLTKAAKQSSGKAKNANHVHYVRVGGAIWI